MSPLNQTYLNRREALTIVRGRLPGDVSYNPLLIKQLDQCREHLDENYMVLLDVLETKKHASIRKQYYWFEESVNSYLKKNSQELYGYLENHYRFDQEKQCFIQTRRKEMERCQNSIGQTLLQYVAPGADFSGEFELEMRAIWSLLKVQY